MIVWFLEALEGWGITSAFRWLASFFRRTPQKDMEKAHDAEDKVAGMADAAVDSQLRSKWER